MPAPSAVLVVQRSRRRPIVGTPLFEALGLRLFVLAKAFLHFLERLETATPVQPLLPVRIQALFALLDDAPLRLHGFVEPSEKVPEILPVCRPQVAVTLRPLRIARPIGVQLAQTAALFIEARLRAAGQLAEATFLGRCDGDELLDSC